MNEEEPIRIFLLLLLPHKFLSSMLACLMSHYFFVVQFIQTKMIFFLLFFSGHQIQCDNSPRKHVRQSSSTFDSLLLCCHDNMCNHDMAENSKKLKPNLTSENSNGKFYQQKQIVALMVDQTCIEDKFQFILLFLNCLLVTIKKKKILSDDITKLHLQNLLHCTKDYLHINTHAILRILYVCVTHSTKLCVKYIMMFDVSLNITRN